jgi:hypothetical protein
MSLLHVWFLSLPTFLSLFLFLFRFPWRGFGCRLSTSFRLNALQRHI